MAGMENSTFLEEGQLGSVGLSFSEMDLLRAEGSAA